MKVLTAEQMREVDRLTIEDGVPSIALMENAAHRVVEEMVREFDPIDRQSIVILCGKGNNGGDGLAIARLLHEYNVQRLRVVLAADPSEFTGDAAANLKRIVELGIHPVFEVPAKLRERREVNVVVDALLGTGLKGPPTGRTAELIASTREFPQAKIVAVDLPSGLGGGGDCVRADITVTFTAPKVEHYLAPGAEEHVGTSRGLADRQPALADSRGPRSFVARRFPASVPAPQARVEQGRFRSRSGRRRSAGQGRGRGHVGTGRVARRGGIGHGGVLRFFAPRARADVGIARQFFAGAHDGAGGRSWFGRSARARSETDERREHSHGDRRGRAERDRRHGFSGARDADRADSASRRDGAIAGSRSRERKRTLTCRPYIRERAQRVPGPQGLSHADRAARRQSSGSTPAARRRWRPAAPATSSPA